MDHMTELPRGALTVRISAMPADTNANGDIFGGWVLSRMDQAGGIAGVERARGRVVTIAVDAMTFIRPVRVGDVLEVFTEVDGIGRTSMKIHIEAWARASRPTSRRRSPTPPLPSLPSTRPASPGRFRRRGDGGCVIARSAQRDEAISATRARASDARLLRFARNGALSSFGPHAEEAANRPSRSMGCNPGPILRDASLRDAPQDEAETK
jgi:acyl-CoA thioesterase YciA